MQDDYMRYKFYGNFPNLIPIDIVVRSISSTIGWNMNVLFLKLSFPAASGCFIGLNLKGKAKGSHMHCAACLIRCSFVSTTGDAGSSSLADSGSAYSNFDKN